MVKIDDNMKGWGSVLKTQGAVAGDRHRITPDLRFETLLKDSDLKPWEKNSLMNIVTRILEKKNLNHLDIRLKDIVNTSYRDFIDYGLTIKDSSKYSRFLHKNGFSFSKEDPWGRFVMRSYPEIKGTDIFLSDVLEKESIQARQNRLKDVTLDMPLDRFLDKADFEEGKMLYYDNIVKAINEWRKQDGPIKDLSEIKLRDLHNIPADLIFYRWSGYKSNNYDAVCELFHKVGIGMDNFNIENPDGSRKDLRMIKIIGKFSEVSNQTDAEKAIHDRIVTPSARRFTPEQIKTLNNYVRSFPNTPAGEVFSELLKEVAQEPDVARKPEKWVADTAKELNDLAEGITREESRGVHK